MLTYPNKKGTGRSGGTGRRARLKLVFLRECGFDSHLRHYTLSGHNILPLSGYEKRETNDLAFFDSDKEN